AMSRSSTGPQMPTWQYAGVEMRTATGCPDARAASSDTSWNGHAGVRVQSWPVMPAASVVVGVFTDGIGWPICGSSLAFTVTDDSSVTPSTTVERVHVPVASKVVSNG